MSESAWVPRLGPQAVFAAAVSGKGGKRKGTRSPESLIQQQLVEVLVGKAVKGIGRQRGAGMTGRWPELALLYSTGGGAAGAARSRSAAGIRKAEGVMAGVPDLVLPVARWPFHGLYVEVKQAGAYPREEQRLYLASLIDQGYAALTIDEVQEGVDLFTAYLRLERWQGYAAPARAGFNQQLDRLVELSGAAYYEHTIHTGVRDV